MSVSEIQQFCNEHPDMTVTIKDSELAGNCTSGSEEFRDLYFPGRQSVTLKELIPHLDRSPGLCNVVEYKVRQFQTPAE